jgi:DNA-binding MarR family transcriptional regulator
VANDGPTFSVESGVADSPAAATDHPMTQRSAKSPTTIRTRRAAAPAAPINVGLLPNLLGYSIRRAQIALWRDLTKTLGRRAVRPAMFSLLILIEANQGIAQIQLGTQLDIDKGTIVGLIDLLQKKKWVSRKQSTGDRRRKGVYLTALGQHELDALKKSMIEHEARFTRLFSADELALFTAFLRRLHP